MAAGCAPAEKPISYIIDEAVENAREQVILLGRKYELRDGLLPRTFEHGKDVCSDSRWWTSGFFPGTLWYVFENTGDTTVLNYARMYTARVEREKYTTDNHDVGFMIGCSFGNGFRLTSDPAYKETLITAAHSLSTRYNEVTGTVRSWDHSTEKWQYPVIIDNMMNLELLMWVAEHTGNDKLMKIAVSHADKTMEHHFRPDYSSYHVVSYDTLTGLPHAKNTHQGYSDSSSWSRGQSWGLYGYTCMYRFTKDKKYLIHACNIASFLMNHRNMPEDGIPYWDYDAAQIPDTPRDASAAAVMASALIELSDYVSGKMAASYMNFAQKQIRSLASDQYTAAPGENGCFILKHSTGAIPFDSEIDTPLTYADYYYLEALTRLKARINTERTK